MLKHPEVEAVIKEWTLNNFKWFVVDSGLLLETSCHQRWTCPLVSHRAVLYLMLSKSIILVLLHCLLSV